MSFRKAELLERAKAFARSRYGRGRLIKLGWGTDGTVWKIQSHQTAIKVFERDRSYKTELSCYQRLKEKQVTTINGCSIPTLVTFSGELQVIEMSLVAPPRVIDFGKCGLDHTAHSAEMLAEKERQNEEIWGEDWPRVSAIVWQLELHGIYYYDVNRDNISLPEE